MTNRTRRRINWPVVFSGIALFCIQLSFLPSTVEFVRTSKVAQAEGSADQSEIGGAFFRRRDIGDIGIGSGIGRPRHARQRPADEQPGDGGREPGDQIIHAQHRQ